MSEHLFGTVDAHTIRMCTGLGGGVGGTHEELCGALSGGVLVIGAAHGRARPDDDASPCRALVAAFRERFIDVFGATRCQDLRDRGFGSTETPCRVVVMATTLLLLDMLAQGEQGK